MAGRQLELRFRPRAAEIPPFPRAHAAPVPARFAEFFAGIGLVRLGLEATGDWACAFANDLDSEKRAMYDAHFADADEHFALADVHTLDVARVPDVELATASFPCTDLSLAGERLGLDQGRQSSAFWGFIRILTELGPRRPALVMLENVVGFITSHQGRDFRSAMLALGALGYTVDVFTLDARCFVPQSRPRLFVVAVLGGEARAPAPEQLGTRLRPPQISAFIRANAELPWRLRDLPEPPAGPGAKLADIVEPLPLDAPPWWSRERADYLYGQLSDRHRAVADAMVARRRWSYGAVFRRVRLQPDGTKRSMAELRTDGLAGCLRTPKGGSGRQILFRAGYGRHDARLLTPRECARLMGAGDFTILAGDNRALFGFGDAVCVPAITWIARNYLTPELAARRAAGPARAAGPV